MKYIRIKHGSPAAEEEFCNAAITILDEVAGVAAHRVEIDEVEFGHRCKEIGLQGCKTAGCDNNMTKGIKVIR